MNLVCIPAARYIHLGHDRIFWGLTGRNRIGHFAPVERRSNKQNWGGRDCVSRLRRRLQAEAAPRNAERMTSVRKFNGKGQKAAARCDAEEAV